MASHDGIYAAVAAALSGMDGSHDMQHVDRVHKLAMHIAELEGITDETSLQIISLGALLHDVADRKYSGSETATAEVSTKLMADAGVTSRVQEGVLAVISSVSYNSEIGGATANPEFQKECYIVQDADRLEAIGAIGIARCMMYGGAKKRAMYSAEDLDEGHCEAILAKTLTKEEYALYSETTIGHFYAKLLRLRSMLKTRSGQKLADERHKFMLTFLEQLKAEIRGEK